MTKTQQEKEREVENVVLWMGSQWTNAVRAGRRMAKYAFVLGALTGLAIGELLL